MWLVTIKHIYITHPTHVFPSKDFINLPSSSFKTHQLGDGYQSEYERIRIRNCPALPSLAFCTQVEEGCRAHVGLEMASPSKLQEVYFSIEMHGMGEIEEPEVLF
ncbi:hypothetical protein PRUPE_5G020300 [Prunus persica]|uniref:Uncharacterized protein n=1 Tax=Prunus persica TaxID=3760 RepID=A0A251P3V6_PRUPE|nr:hypothetical protein PRUPE_5G020300 [Prunus persica]